MKVDLHSPGIVPMKADVMAAKTVDLMTTKLISMEDVFARLDPNKVASLLGPALHSMLANLIAGVARQYSPTVWSSMPERYACVVVVDSQTLDRGPD